MRKWPCVGCGVPFTMQEERDHNCDGGYISNATGWYHRQCPVCKSWPPTNIMHHCVTRRNGVDISKRRWDHTMNAWVLDMGQPDKPAPEAKFWDGEKKDWVAEKDFYATSCEVPPDHWLTKKKEKEKKEYGTSYSYGGYKPCYPWEGIDRKKWPNTWWNLFMQYHQYSWHSLGCYITADDWEARLKGEYRKEPKWGRHSSTTYYSSYGED